MSRCGSSEMNSIKYFRRGKKRTQRERANHRVSRQSLLSVARIEPGQLTLSTAGITPAAPFVGAVTTLPPPALVSLTAIAYSDKKSNPGNVGRLGGGGDRGWSGEPTTRGAFECADRRRRSSDDEADDVESSTKVDAVDEVGSASGSVDGDDAAGGSEGVTGEVFRVG